VTASSEYDDDTAVTQRAEGSFHTRVTDRWGALGTPVNGGYLLGSCVRALRHSLGRPDPIGVSAFFLQPGQVGEAEITTEVVRAGRRLATGQVSLFQGGTEMLRALADFGDLSVLAGHTQVDNAPPELPPPDDCVDLTAGHSIPGISIVDRVEYRVETPPGWTTGQPSGRAAAAFWMRLRDGRQPDTISLVSLVDAGWPAVLELGVAGSSTVQLSVHVRGRPEPGWLACRVHTQHVIAGMHEEDFEIWDSKGHLVAQSRQLALLTG
jgi:acyl-CoA thioesterase